MEQIEDLSINRYREPNELRLHPLAHLIPDMQEEEWDFFVKDVEEHGIKVPLDILSDGTILDGKHRHRAALLLNISRVPVRIYDVPLDEDDSLLHMWRTAVLRRHLAQGQVAAIAIEFNQCLTENKLTGQDLAAKFSVSRRNVVRANVVHQNAPELIDTVRSGALSLTEAETLSKEPTEIRNIALDKMKNNPNIRADVAIRKTKQDTNRKTIAKGIKNAHLLDEYKVIVADPCWDYSEIGYASQGSNYRGEPDYEVMTLEQIAGLEIKGKHVAEYVGDEGHLYLWVTNPFIEHGFDIMRAWGFEYRAIITWAKTSMGLGRYFRHNTEHVLFGVRGALQTLDSTTPTWFKADRGKHSEKPDHFYSLVESCSPAPYLELFSRKERKGWSNWGVIDK